jgi:hypothetical protein
MQKPENRRLEQILALFMQKRFYCSKGRRNMNRREIIETDYPYF